uniref:sodium-independent anion transporter n=1 Tax=Streptomyces polyasparticus TaxID=2767826 RepID=UPI00280BF3B8|nr:sodium-independent anion transporter [Streptomyces polyasparticus]
MTVLYYGGSSLFAEAPRLDEQWPDTKDARGAAVVLGLRGVPDVPSSAVLKLLRRYARDLRSHGGRLYLAGVEPRLLAVLQRTGLAQELGEDAVLPPTPTCSAPSARRWPARGAGRRTGPRIRRPREPLKRQRPAPPRRGTAGPVVWGRD